jgi:hypothetical protein
MQLPLVGEMPPVASLDLAHVGLSAALKVPLPTGMAGPLEPCWASGEGLTVLLFLYFSLFFITSSSDVIDVCLCVCLLGSSADTLSDWAEYLNALYKEIGGYLRPLPPPVSFLSYVAYVPFLGRSST